jgi:sulfite reductase beta subunit-like hemoprotein
MPCCYIGSDYLEQPIEEILPIHKLRNQSVQNTKDIINNIGLNTCQSGILDTDGILFGGITDYWEGKDKCMTCVKACSTAIVEPK